MLKYSYLGFIVLKTINISFQQEQHICVLIFFSHKMEEEEMLEKEIRRILIWDYRRMSTDLSRPNTSDFFYSEGLRVEVDFCRIILFVRFYEEMHSKTVKEIEGRVRSLVSSGKFPFSYWDKGGIFKFNYKIEDGEDPCETAAKRAIMVFKAFGIPVEEIDPRDFRLEEKSYIKDGEEKVSLEDYLKSRYQITKRKEEKNGKKNKIKF